MRQLAYALRAVPLLGVFRAVTPEAFLAVEFNQPADQFVHFARDDAVEFMNGQSAAVISDPILWVIVGADPLAAITGSDQRATSGGSFFFRFVLPLFQNAAFEHLQGLGSVFVLTFFVLNFDDDPGRNMSHPDGTFRLVNFLSAWPSGAHRVDLQIVRIDFDFNIGGFRQHSDGRRAGVDAALSFRFGNALHAMTAAFELQRMVGSFPGNRHHDFFDPAEFRGAELDEFHFPLSGFAVTRMYMS